MNDVEELTLENLLNVNLSNPKQFNQVIYFFQNYLLDHEIGDNIKILNLFFTKKFQKDKSLVFSLLFREIFSLGVRMYHAQEKEEEIQVVIPARLLYELYENNNETISIIGNLIQIDHDDFLGYNFSQIMGWLLENELISIKHLSAILKAILLDEGTTNIKIGRFIGNLLLYKIIDIQNMLTLVDLLVRDINLTKSEISNIIIGIRSKKLTKTQEDSLLEYFLTILSPKSSINNKAGELSESIEAFGALLSNDLCNNKPINHVILICMKSKKELLVADTLKYLLDTLIISEKKVSEFIIELLNKKMLRFEELASIISSKFTKKEILSILINIMKLKNDNISKQDFINLLASFLNHKYHDFTRFDFKSILEYMKTYESDLFERLFEISVEEILNNLIYQSKN